jgi:hypothetical protein
MRLTSAFLLAVVGSLAANLILLFLLRPLVIDPAMPLKALGAAPVTIFTVAGVVGATIVYALMRRWLVAPNKAFVALSIVVLLLSFVPDYLIIGQTTGRFAGGNEGSAFVLMLMHVVTAIIVVWALTTNRSMHASNRQVRI